jgi:uncharacterized protein (TIGR01777 family)
MNVLLTGASGLIGTAVQTALRERGDHVLVLARPSSVTTPPESIAWDPAAGFLDLAALEAAGPLDAVIHLAGAGIADKRWSESRKHEILRSRTASTELLVKSLGQLSNRPSVLVSGSAIGIYGSRGDEILTESSSAGTGFLADVCREWESAGSAATTFGIRTVLARTGIVLSPHGGALAKQLPLFKMALGGRLGSGTQWLSWISLDDEVAGLLAALDQKDLEGPVNLTAPEPVTNATFTKALGGVLHRPTVFATPGVALKTLLGAELVDEALLASQRVIPAALQSTGFKFEDTNVSEALSRLLA